MIFVKRCNLFLFLALFLVLAFPVCIVIAQELEQPDRSNLFLEDAVKDEKAKEEIQQLQQREAAIQSYRQTGKGLPFDINAPNLRYDSATQQFVADGGLTFSYSTATAEAEKALISVEKNEATLSGNVRISDVRSEIRAEEIKLNFNTGEAEMNNSHIVLQPGGYRIVSKTAKHHGQEVYSLGETLLTTCDCADGESSLPWHISAERAEIVREGYAQLWDTYFYVRDVPVFYLPYSVFPVMTERQSGLLPFTFGGGSESGFKMEAPVFWAIDRSTDVTLTGLLQTKTRYGAATEFRKVFSENHQHESGMLFVDETARGDSLRGTNVDGLFDPTIDQQRFAAYMDHSWFSEVGDVPLQLVIDGNYTSDDLVLRELPTDKVGEEQSRFVDSVATASASILETYSLGATADYSQAIVDNDDTILQRLPYLYLTGFTNYKPFGQSPYGLKFTLNNSLSSTNYARQEGVDGWKSEAYEKLKFVSYYKNYFTTEVIGDARLTNYSLNSDTQQLADGQEELPNSSDRVVPGVETKISTSIDRVFNVADEGLFRNLLDVGLVGRRERVERVKHTARPFVKHRYVPDVDQSDNPQFDRYDRLAERNVFTYGFEQLLHARYEPRNKYLYGIEEATPEVGDLGSLSSNRPLDEDLAFGVRDSVDPYQVGTRGSVTEIASLSIAQSYDMIHENDDAKKKLDALSDVSTDFSFFPNEYFRTRFGTDFNVQETSFSAYRVEGQFSDKFGNEIRSRLRFVDNSIRQLETSAQAAITDYIRIGHYSRYDDFAGEFIESKVGMRYISTCRCWTFDINLSEETNPNETSLTFNVTLLGLGNVGNQLFSFIDDDIEQRGQN